MYIELKKLNYGRLIKNDIANGIGVRVSLFVSGCENRCEGCFQPETWDYDYGSIFTEDTQRQIVDLLKPDWVDGLSILGGDPFEPSNQRGLIGLIRFIDDHCYKKTIWVYTGYTFEELRDPVSRVYTEVTEEMLKRIDVLVDGRFEEDKKDLTLRFRGSSNQRIIDVPASLEKDEIVLAEEYY